MADLGFAAAALGGIVSGSGGVIGREKRDEKKRTDVRVSRTLDAALGSLMRADSEFGATVCWFCWEG